LPQRAPSAQQLPIQGTQPSQPSQPSQPPQPSQPSQPPQPEPGHGSSPPPPPMRWVRHQLRQQRSSRSSRRSQAGRHVGIICDGCNARDFAGVRYKCLSCPDFDFCAVCHDRRAALHPGHDFEMISTPRSAVPPMIQDFLARAAARTSIAIIGIGLHGSGDAQAASGLDDASVAWWLADSRQVVREEDVAALDPPWSCPICAEGVEAESSNGWVVQICGGSSLEGRSSPSSPSSPTAAEQDDSHIASSREGGASSSNVPCVEADAAAPGGADVSEEQDKVTRLDPQGHVYHETCLRRWLVKSNSCPVCRRTPVVPESPEA